MVFRYLIVCALTLCLAGCAMSEEIKRIDELKHSESEKQASMSTDLNGEQIFFRSCNTCHPTGRKGPLAPALDQLDEHFATDQLLKSFLRKGKGIMPAQTKDVLNDKEMDSLIVYLRHIND
jgi:mono/diheme cytochrome c family protein